MKKDLIAKHIGGILQSLGEALYALSDDHANADNALREHLQEAREGIEAAEKEARSRG